MEEQLKRTLGLPLLTFYGLGTIVGAGIYVLIGEVAGVSGSLLPVAFVIAGVVAGLTGASYAELSARYPRAAGAALYVDAAFGNLYLSRLTGFGLLFTGVVSSATICKGFTGYLNLYVSVPEIVAIPLLCLGLFLVASWGIKESAWLITLITLLEVGGLLLVVYLAGSSERTTDSIPVHFGVTGVLLGSFLAFYAFIGFEDMVNLAEEVKDPEVTLPRAILLSIAISIGLYVVVALAALLWSDLESISRSDSPLAVMVGDSPTGVWVIGLISLVAVVNGALVQVIMAARVLYGMAMREMLPRFFARVNRMTQTPVLNTLLIVVVILCFALWLPMITLAKITSAVMLCIFALVNLSLIQVKRREHGEAPFVVPVAVPVAGSICCVSILLYQFFA